MKCRAHIKDNRNNDQLQTIAFELLHIMYIECCHHLYNELYEYNHIRIRYTFIINKKQGKYSPAHSPRAYSLTHKSKYYYCDYSLIVVQISG